MMIILFSYLNAFIESIYDVGSSDDQGEFEEQGKSKKQNCVEKEKQSNAQGFHLDNVIDQEILVENEDPAVELQVGEHLIETDGIDESQGKIS